jgi:3-phenylpropionate/trans-cinnamate dioxygenase ferredoxin subunit
LILNEVAVEPLAENSSQVIGLDGYSILLCNSAGKHYAIANQCSHQDSPLEKGRIRNGYISCPLHGVRFSLETGEPMGVQLTRVPVKTYEVIEDQSSVRIKIE